MTRPTGHPWRIWKKREIRKLLREGAVLPTDWVRYWESLNAPSVPDEGVLDQLRLARLECSRLRSEALTHRMVRREILGLSEATPEAPDWVLRDSSGKAPRHQSVPTLLACDWHWGERVDPGQVGGVNAYDMATAHERVKTLISRTVNILKHHMKHPHFPGIVFALAGDFVSGDIHDELSRTNEKPIMPVLLDLYGVMIWAIETLADEFGRVFVPAVAGNHARITQKPFAKDRAGLNFDWLLYCLLEKHFVKDSRIQFMIPDGPDATYRLHGHTYCLTHGDQFRGGTGMAGAVNPILRGDHKKRSRNGQIEMPYDTLVHGHWHQTLNLGRVIVGGSLIGYNEYAFNGNFPFEPPTQSLWLTHPEHGITFMMPIRVEDRQIQDAASWVSWPAVE